jgi:transketolase
MIMANAEFTDLDWKCINTVRVLAADMVQAANSGHPGAPMGLAPVAHVLFTRFFKFDPKNPKWVHGVLLTALI